MRPRIVALVGPTASGKTDLAVEAIQRSSVSAEIIVLDSRQLYRGLDLGTGKPDAAQRAAVPHHLLDVLEPGDTPDAMDYRRRVEAVAHDILHRGSVPCLVGGAGFYLRALREGFHDFEHSSEELADVRASIARLDDGELLDRLRKLDPDTADRLHPNDRYRIGRAVELCELSGRRASELEREFIPKPVLGATFDIALLLPERQVLHERIERRTASWLRHGWLEEVQGLLERGVSPSAPGLQILGYRQVVELVEGRTTPSAAETDITVATRRYARAQTTWFRKERPVARFAEGDDEAVQTLDGMLRGAVGPA